MAKKRTIEAKIISNEKIAPDHYVMELRAPQLSSSSSAGQFVLVKVLEKTTDPLLRIPLGIHAKRKNNIKLLYKVVGPATEILSSKKKGEMAGLLGPLGNGFDLSPLRKKDSRAVLVAGGHGIAPLYCLAEEIAGKKKEMDVFSGACERKHLLLSKELKKMGAKVTTATEDGSCGCRGYVTGPLEKFLKNNKKHLEKMTIYACGPRPMLAAVAKEAARHNVNAQASLDAYMACGIGSCLGCAIETTGGYKLVCKDGPVFDAKEIKWDKIGKC